MCKDLVQGSMESRTKMKARCNYGFYHFRVLIVMIWFLQFQAVKHTNANCVNRLIGVENKYIIPDSSFTASSYYNTRGDTRYVPSNGRLNGNYGWGPSTNNDPDDYLQIDLGLPYVICAVATQGRSTGDEWVTQYEIRMSMDNTTWTSYQENGRVKSFVGNSNHDSIQKHTLSKPLARYIRFIPTRSNRYKTMRVGIYGYVEGCENLPLGMESGVIQDGSITASSSQNQAKNARLHYTSDSSWCASTSDSTPYLQIDLGTHHLICAVSTQGNSMADKWVKTYQITTSTDGTTWTTYQENNTDRTFYGNFDRTTGIRQVLYQGIVTRYLRILPKTYSSTPCLRTEIYGYSFQSDCPSHSVGIPSSLLVPNHRFTATSSYSDRYLPYKGRLGASTAWIPYHMGAGVYVQVDLGERFYICAVATQGHWYYNYWVKKYYVKYSTNNVEWSTYRESGANKEFLGNTDRGTVKTNPITNPFRAKFVRVLPTSYRSSKSMRIEFKGLPIGCVSSLGVENSQIPDSQMTSSSSSDNSHTASRGRLYGGYSWCSSTTSNPEYIQIDLGQIKTVTGIATQGDKINNKWVTSYKVSYSFDNRYWNEYREGQFTKVFSSNSNKNDVIVNWLSRPIAAHNVRIYPQTSRDSHCLRLDLYGCAMFNSPKASLVIDDLILPSTKGSSRTLTCSILGEPIPDIQWFNNGTKINGATQPTLRVHFVSAEHVVSKYNCIRQGLDSRAVVCNTFCTCRATYPNYVPGAGISVARGNITVILNIPEPLTFRALANKRSITLTWATPTPTDDVGQITWYKISFTNQSVTPRFLFVNHPGSSYNLLYLKPYTNYRIRMKTISSVGEGLWSSLQSIRTSIAKPGGVPVITALHVKSSQRIQVNWQFTEFDKLNGPLAGYTVKYTSSGGTPLTTQIQGNVKTVTLDSLEKYTLYSITVLVRNTQFSGPESAAHQARTNEDAPSCSPTLLTAKATSSTSVVVTWRPFSQGLKCLNGVLKFLKVLYRKKSGGSTASLQTDKTHSSKEIPNLDKYTVYTFEVLAHTVGDGPRSNALEATTLQDAPSEPVNPRGSLLPPQSDIRVPRVRITWEKPQHENGIVKRYDISYMYGMDSTTQKLVTITDIDQLSYTMNVLGESNIKFKIRAYTIEEGPYTFYRYGTIPAYPPAIGPKETRSTKINETTFKITWQPLPRDQSNGIVTKYEVTWHRIEHRRRRSAGQSSTASTRGSQYTIYNLRLCAQYTVYVKGFTKAGPGPNSTVVVVTSQPGAPENVKLSGKGKTSIELKWDKPLGVTREIKSYKIIMKGFKSYWEKWEGHNVSEDFMQRGDKSTKLFQNLKPGTRYAFWVTSITECGESNKSASTSVDTDVEAPLQPKGKPMKLQNNYNVSLWPVKPENGPISSYHVIVINGESADVNFLPDILHNYKDSKSKSQEYYIAAELKANAILEQFPVGDGKMYGGYQNVPLKKGRTYTIGERAITVNDKKIYFGKAAKVATIQLSAEPGKDGKFKGSPLTGPVAGGIIGFLLILGGVLLGFFLYKRRHKTKDSHRESSLVLDDIANNGYQEMASIGTVDSKEEQNKYYNQVDTAPPIDDIYDQAVDDAAKPIPINQFAQYLTSNKATDYARLKKEFKDLPNAQLFSTSVAKTLENKKKNRYGNIVTYNHSRVVIGRSGDESSDYINASYINGFDGTPKVYIAAQGPVPQTFADFWQMIWEQNTSTIVMLTNLKEGNKTKCHQYWPESEEIYQDITVINHKTEVFPDYIIRTLLLTNINSEETRHVLHFQFTVWPDKGVPHYATAVLGLRRKVKAKNPQNAGPVVVHCSAGVGRTGAYIVIDAMLDRAKKLRNVDILGYVTMIRKARPYMVQTDEQYVFIHLAVLEVLTCGNTEIQAHNLEIVINKLTTASPSKPKNGFATEFERLNLVTADFAEDCCDIGRTQENASKNRYPNVIALNNSRVLLSRETTDKGTDYINASFIHAYRKRNAFIMAQAPLPNTIEDFWIMVSNYEIRTIVMLNTLEEDYEHFPQYWPQSGVQTYGCVTIELLGTQDIGELVSRRFKVTYASSSIRVQQLQHVKWSDKCIPANPQSVLDLLNEVEQSQRQSSNLAPVVVHCSNGVGRSGTFCAIYSILERMKQEQIIDVFQVVKCIRSNRPGAVESLNQYIFCYQIIQKYLELFDDYANFSNR